MSPSYNTTTSGRCFTQLETLKPCVLGGNYPSKGNKFSFSVTWTLFRVVRSVTHYGPSTRKKYYTLEFVNFAELGLSGCECNDSPRLWKEAHEELKGRSVINQVTSSSNLFLGNLHFEWVKCSGLDNRRDCFWHSSVALSKYTLIYTAKGCQVDDVRDKSKTCSCLYCNPSDRLGLQRVRHGLITFPMGQLQGLCARRMRSDMQNNVEPHKPHQPVSLNNSLKGLNLWLVAPYIQPDHVPRDSTAW